MSHDENITSSDYRALAEAIRDLLAPDHPGDPADSPRRDRLILHRAEQLATALSWPQTPPELTRTVHRIAYGLPALYPAEGKHAARFRAASATGGSVVSLAARRPARCDVCHRVAEMPSAPCPHCPDGIGR